MKTPDFEVSAGYRALNTTVGIAPLRPRTQIEMTGRDRASFLHAMCTNDIKKLATGAGCEAFLTNVQGKTIGHIYVYCGVDSLTIETAPAQAESIIGELSRYVVREKVEMVDRTLDWGELLLAGPDAQDFMRRAVASEVPSVLFSHSDVQWRDMVFSVRRVPFVAPCSYLLSAKNEFLPQMRHEFEKSGATLCDEETVETCRVESGTPLFGIDVTAANLPQEVGRTETAISFKKGCYLGQETVARLDSLGHVNRQLMGLKLPPSVAISRGFQLNVEGKLAAEITSAVWSPRLQATLALAYVRRSFASPGTRFVCEYGECEVIALPLTGAVA